jgi:hypothetical protein
MPPPTNLREETILIATLYLLAIAAIDAAAAEDGIVEIENDCATELQAAAEAREDAEIDPRIDALVTR